METRTRKVTTQARKSPTPTPHFFVRLTRVLTAPLGGRGELVLLFARRWEQAKQVFADAWAEAEKHPEDFLVILQHIHTGEYMFLACVTSRKRKEIV